MWQVSSPRKQNGDLGPLWDVPKNKGLWTTVMRGIEISDGGNACLLPQFGSALTVTSVTGVYFADLALPR